MVTPYNEYKPAFDSRGPSLAATNLCNYIGKRGPWTKALDQELRIVTPEGTANNNLSEMAGVESDTLSVVSDAAYYSDPSESLMEEAFNGESPPSDDILAEVEES